MIHQASDHEDLIEASPSCRSRGDRHWRLRIHGLHCSGRIRKQDRGLIDLGCESETRLRRTHDKGKGVRATPSNNLIAIFSLTRLGWSRSVVGSDFHTDARSARPRCLIAASSVFADLAKSANTRSRPPRACTIIFI